MPHKHTRREKDEAAFDLPPSEIARPLPVNTLSRRNDGKKQGVAGASNPGKRKRDATVKNDAPRAFKRLMAFAGGKRPRSGLDDGDPRDKKNKAKKAATNNEDRPEVSEGKEVEELPKIRPGERMSEFASRVDAALPVGGLINKTAKDPADPLGLKTWRTKKERKMHKLYEEWREEDRKIKEKREDDAELAAEKELDDEENGVSWKFDTQGEGGAGKKKKKGKRAKYLGEAAGAEEDPWAELKRKRGETRPGLRDVAKAPPELHKKLSKKLTVRGAAVSVEGVPKAAGSLRRREELQGVREDVVASYRKLMESKRPRILS